MLNQSVFEQYIVELESYYNKTLSNFIRQVWYDRLSKMTNEEFIQSVSLAACKHKFMPTADELRTILSVEDQELDNRPKENHQAYQNARASLPSEQMRMTDEEREENLQRINCMIRGAKKSFPKPSSEAFAYTKGVVSKWRDQGLINNA